MIEELLPDSVVAVELHGDDAIQDAPLYPEEEALMARAVAKRRREFSSVRACARRAMEKLGVPAQPVVTGESGAPRWPAGLVGSMTHSDGYCAAALVRATDLASLGIDAEPDEPLPEDVVSYVFLPAENERLRLLEARSPDVHWDRILFSAKESVYKAWFPLTGQWLDFGEADIELSADPGERRRGTLRAELLVPGPQVGGSRLQRFEGRWSVQRGVVTTAVVVPHAA
ncbi:4'-phosphopantetheinyl transferase family protein [Streptomyces olivochromogenes]|uniref:4'-phosphopantetheinyl transferase family protein n=1 Tax=Streptomyces olivochromogenes TaxID=1963 RepID=UPI001F45D5DC|nr:4'-phosphopantetheinyl transferase superfamily protein [Streptomyces olivochromogenes]MCF3129386.1 4'-phosphopantetheinyl transferase superfamily protein [Streptomyces olivochromogenes]